MSGWRPGNVRKMSAKCQVAVRKKVWYDIISQRREGDPLSEGSGFSDGVEGTTADGRFLSEIAGNDSFRQLR